MNGASPSRPVQQLLERLERVEIRNGSYQALCPAHDDRQPSLNLSEGEDGRALIKCFAGCAPERITDALGLQMYDLFEHHNGNPAGGRRPSGPPARPPTRQHTTCTLQAYAEAKALPADFLGRLGLSDITYSGSPAVRIPYFDQDGEETAVRIRLALQKHPDRDDRFRWRRGSKPTLYGLWRLPRIRNAGYVVLVEGESDCHTLWHHGIEALGIPGASSWKVEWTAHLEGVDKVYAIIEPDQGGIALWDRLAASPLREKLHRVDLDGAKDPSELHLQNPAHFKVNLRGIQAGEALVRRSPRRSRGQRPRGVAGVQGAGKRGPHPGSLRRDPRALRRRRRVKSAQTPLPRPDQPPPRQARK